MIVAIESASTDPSVAVATDDGRLLQLDGWSAAPRQAHELLPRLMTALTAAGGSTSEVAGIGIGLGPGSFTGLRVGMSVAKGLAFALGCPVVGVPSLQAWLEAGVGTAWAGPVPGDELGGSFWPQSWQKIDPSRLTRPHCWQRAIDSLSGPRQPAPASPGPST